MLHTMRSPSPSVGISDLKAMQGIVTKNYKVNMDSEFNLTFTPQARWVVIKGAVLFSSQQS